MLTLRDLWRRRRSVMVGTVVALAAALLVSFSVRPGIPPRLESRQYEAGVAGAEVLVDSPTSQVVDVGGASSDVAGQATDFSGLGARAHLLAGLMASSPLKDRIADAAGIASERFLVIAPTGDEPGPEEPPGTSRLAADRETTVVDLFVDETLPIISTNVRAPDATTAGRAARAAVSELRAYVESVASAGGVDISRQLVVAPVSEPSAGTIVKGPRRLFAIAAFVLVLFLWCAAVVMRPSITTTWREAARADDAAAGPEPAQEPAGELATDEPAVDPGPYAVTRGRVRI